MMFPTVDPEVLVEAVISNNPGLYLIVRDTIHVVSLVSQFFNGDIKKTEQWFCTKNPLFGGEISPMDMILLGRVDKLRRIIEEQLAENKP